GIGVRLQSSLWFWGYGALLLMVAAGSVFVFREAPVASPGSWRVRPGEVNSLSPSWKTRAFWLSAAFVPSALMLAVTNHLLLNLASVPFLWVMPLALYLITFMIAFARRFRIS